MKWPTNVGYAIERLEKVFFDVLVTMADGDKSRVCFAYPSCESGRPRWAAADFTNIESLDVCDTSPRNLRRIERLARDHRVDFALTFDLQPVHPAYRALRRGGVRGVVSYWGAPISGVQPRWKVALKRLRMAMSNSRVDGLVFESDAMASLAVHARGVPRSMIDVVPLGVDVDRYQRSQSGYVHTTFGIPADRRVVVYSGHCNERKGVHVLVDAAIQLLHHRGRRDVCFLICGNKGDESKPFEARFDRFPDAKPWIRFAGYRHDLDQIFSSAFCGAIASVGWDSFTLSSVEMAAAGLPIVASRLQGLAESVLDRETGLLFAPGNSAEMADRISELLDNPGLASVLGARARQRCESELSLVAQKSRLLQAFRRRLASGQ